MKTRLASIFIVLLMAFTLIPAALVSNEQPAQAADVVTCSDIRINTDQVRVVCTLAGVVVLNDTINLPPGPTVQVTLPQATVTVHVPGPSVVQTVRVPVPGPTQSVTVTVPVAGPTTTATATVKTTKTAHATSTITATATTTKSTGQDDNGSGTMNPEPSDPVVSIPNINTPAQAAAVGGIILLILSGLALLALYVGYTLGYKDSDKANANFMRALLGRSKGR
jgi:hypothetical protein